MCCPTMDLRLLGIYVGCMAAANEDIYDRFLESRGHEPEAPDWERDHNKKRCPECMGLHELEATACGVCGWEP